MTLNSSIVVPDNFGGPSPNKICLHSQKHLINQIALESNN